MRLTTVLYGAALGAAALVPVIAMPATATTPSAPTTTAKGVARITLWDNANAKPANSPIVLTDPELNRCYVLGPDSTEIAKVDNRTDAALIPYYPDATDPECESGITAPKVPPGTAVNLVPTDEQNDNAEHGAAGGSDLPEYVKFIPAQ
ncbi:hypothetical protein ACN20G_28225 (plasmid) [Streptomyces sp. BI20]|uniref:hypothetical protein n=1 Tax=Streptomyces sp. BI20 TaxID=3403460 RepID=UPI003C71265F